MGIRTMEQPSSAHALSLCYARNRKKRPYAANEITSSEMVADNSDLLRCQKKSKLTCEREEEEEEEEEEERIEFDHESDDEQISNEIEYEDVVDAPKKQCRNIDQNSIRTNFFDELPDDLVIVITSKLSASTDSFSDIINFSLTCKRFNEFSKHPWVLAKASARSLSLRAKLWCEPAHQFLKMCADVGNLDACYILGMIYFYCLKNRRQGAGYMAKAAVNAHPWALFSLAIIQFNGSGGPRSNMNLPAGVTLCARAAQLGHLDALRELGYCLQDGYGIRPDLAQSRRILCEAAALELAEFSEQWDNLTGLIQAGAESGSVVEMDLDTYVRVMDPHPANRFLMEWSAARDDVHVRACSHVLCGRVETRRHEFRRCAVCCRAYYCSRACQARDWKRAHQNECAPTFFPLPEPLQILVGAAAEWGPHVNGVENFGAGLGDGYH